MYVHSTSSSHAMFIDQHVSNIEFNNTSLHQIVQFNQSISIPSTNLLISSFPLIINKSGIRFKIFILILTFAFALLIGFLLSLILISQIIHISNSKIFPSVEQTIHSSMTSKSINQLNLNRNICENFYKFICSKWLIEHPLSTLDFKRSWLTEQSKDIREKFSRILTNFSTNYQNKLNHIYIDDDQEYLSIKNELEQFYSYHDNQHHLLKHELISINYSQSLSNMFHFYHQCLHTSSTNLNKQIHQFIFQHFSFKNLDIIFKQLFQHSFIHLWNINIINFDTQIIIHIQRQIQNQEDFFILHQYKQAILFENYLYQQQIHICSQSSLSITLKQYQELIFTSISFTNTSIHDDLQRLINNDQTLSIISSSIKYSNELKDFIQIMFDKNIFQSNDYYEFFSNFTYDLKIHLINIPIFRSTISYQCQLYLKYYIAIRSFNQSNIQSWLNYIASSILQIILHSWPGDASYTCLYSTIVRHQQFQNIFDWNQLIEYTKKQIQHLSSPIITMEIRLIDFFQLDSIFRFLSANQYSHYCHLMVYKYGPKLLPFLSIFDENIEINLKNLWKQTFINNTKEQSNIYLSPFPSHRIPNDCLALLEFYYPFTLSSFYEEIMSKKIHEFHSVINKFRNNIMKNYTETYLSSLQFHIQSERLKLFKDYSPISSPIPYEFYSIDKDYLSTAWNLIEYSHEKFIEPIYEFFEINGHHTIEQGIFLQPTIAELYSNESTRLAALLLIAHEFGHALCPCGINHTEREYFADRIALHLIINYMNEESNENLKKFFFNYGQMECLHINREMISLMNKQENFIEYHINRVLNNTEEFQRIFHCSTQQYRQNEQLKIILSDLCQTCRINRYEKKFSK